MEQRLAVQLGDWQLDNPIIPASGTFGFGYEFQEFYDINILGSIATKGTTLEPRFGNPTPRIAECTNGMINSVGLQNPGLDKVVTEEFAKLQKIFHKKVVANISGFSIEEYVACAKRMDEQDIVGIIEVNISCPNVKHGGMSFGTDPKAAYEVTKAVKEVVKHKPVYIKLSPNVTDIVAIAKACEEAGADGISMINTLLGSRFDLKTGKPIIHNIMGGFSGPAILPVALRMVYQVFEAVQIPIIGIGGISKAEDVIEMMSAGATAVQIGAENCRNPYVCKEIIERLPQLMDELHIDRLQDIIGRAHR
ncbi:MAG: dihydroorotate dehydrogenase [Erysipelotrichaceae bacterium]|nr:dihydroorotate dehydrogenase [Erysipelotrichaceae bacterium]